MDRLIDYTKIGCRIRSHRHLLGLSQERLAEQVDVSPSYISLLENGHKTASLNVLCRMASVLGVTLDWLICGMTAEDNHSISSAFQDCTPEDIQLLCDIVTAVRHILQQHRDI